MALLNCKIGDKVRGGYGNYTFEVIGFHQTSGDLYLQRKSDPGQLRFDIVTKDTVGQWRKLTI